MFLIILILLPLHLFITDYLTSVWLLSSPYGRSDFWRCASVCVDLLPACARAVWVCVCASFTVDNFSVCTACLCPLCDTGSSVLPVCFLHCVSVCARVMTLAPVVRLHDSKYSYGVLLCADAWPVWESVSVSVCVCMTVCGQTLSLKCGSFWCSARFDRRCCTMHSMYLSSSGYLVLSGFGKWFLLSVHVCNLFSSCSVPLLYRKALLFLS